MTCRALWVDDDADGVLAPVIATMRGHVQALQTAGTFESAEEKMTGLLAQGPGDVVGIVDVIVGRENSPCVPSWALGINLADMLLKGGAKRVAFVSIVPVVRVAKMLEELRMRYGDDAVRYDSKLELLEPGRMDALVAYVARGEV